MSRGNLRCNKCRTNYKPFSNTQLSKINIDYSKWLVLIKLFDLGISARKATVEDDVSYPTALHSFDTIRFSILEEQSKTDDHKYKEGAQEEMASLEKININWRKINIKNSIKY